MTTFNRESYVAAAIESVLAQRFGDFELIIVDDRSTDGTLTVADTYAARDARIRVFRNDRNLGDYPNRNRAASYARGTFLKYHDSDDVMYPHCLEVMVPPLVAEPSAALALTARGAWPGGPAPMRLSPQLAYEREFIGSGLFMGGPSCALFRRDAFEAIGGFAQAGAESDYLTWLKICARYPIVLVPGDLFWYRTHAGQQLQTVRAQRDYARIHGHAWAALHAPECPLKGDTLRRAKMNAAAMLMRHLWRDLRSGQWGLATYRWRHAGISTAQLVRYLRPPRRETNAGTPVAATSKAVQWSSRVAK